MSMRLKVWNLLDDAVSHVPHKMRKQLKQVFQTAADLFDPPPCGARHCCWQPGARVPMEFCRQPEQ